MAGPIESDGPADPAPRGDPALVGELAGTPAGSAPERIVREGLPLLAPGGRLVLYTGSAIEAGRDAFRDAVLRMVDPARHDVRYREIDPDVFGEELEREPYRDAERIAAVGLVVRRTDEALAQGGA